jgi:predicted nucleotidyltransferase
MSKTEAKKIAKKYSEKLKAKNFPFLTVYLFGSYARNKAHKWSDIDIAVITEKLKKNRDKSMIELWRAREGVDNRIEPHGFTPEDFKINEDPMVYEIKKTGIRIR